MNKIILFCALVLMALPGCKKKDSTVTAPNVSGFSVIAQAYIFDSSATVTVYAPFLAAGNYKVRFYYFNDTVFGSIYASAALTMSNGTGSFQTPALAQKGVTYITIDSFINSQNVATYILKLVTATDSTGLMTAVIGDTSFRAVYVDVMHYGALLDASFVYYVPGDLTSKIIGFQIPNFTGIGQYSFAHDFLGGNAYISTQIGPTVIDTAGYGIINITATSPHLQGSISFTLHDSTKVSGSFTGPGL